MTLPTSAEAQTHQCDILVGAAAIAEYLFGDPRMQQQVLAILRRNEFPHFHLNGRVCSTREAIRRMAWRLLEREKYQGAHAIITQPDEAELHETVLGVANV